MINKPFVVLVHRLKAEGMSTLEIEGYAFLCRCEAKRSGMKGSRLGLCSHPV